MAGTRRLPITQHPGSAAVDPTSDAAANLGEQDELAEVRQDFRNARCPSTNKCYAKWQAEWVVWCTDNRPKTDLYEVS